MEKIRFCILKNNSLNFMLRTHCLKACGHCAGPKGVLACVFFVVAILSFFLFEISEKIEKSDIFKCS